METAIKIDGGDLKEAVEPVADALVRVLASISQGRIDRETGLKALDVLGRSTSIGDITVTHCNFNSKATPVLSSDG